MRGFMRLWAMCMHLALTSPLTWGLTAGVLFMARRGAFPKWACPVAVAGVAAISLLFALLYESDGALSEHIRLSQSQRPVLTAAGAVVATLALVTWAACRMLMP